jgi:hypothetical protein
MYTTFFHYLESRAPSVLWEGVLLRSIKRDGMERGFAEAFGETLASLEEKWRSYLEDRYGDVSGIACDGFPEKLLPASTHGEEAKMMT